VPGKGNTGLRGQLRWLADVTAPAAEDGTLGKAEGLVWRSDRARSERYELTVLFDSLPNGAPKDISVAKRSAGETPATELCRADRH